MCNRKQYCLLAGVCCVFNSVIFAQTEWPGRTPLADTIIKEHRSDEEINNDPPPIYYTNKPSALVFIDGKEPIIIVDEYLRMYRIVNTPHLIIKNHHDNKYYLYGGRYWYVADSATTNYNHLKVYPEVIKLIDSLIKQDEKKAAKLKVPDKMQPVQIKPMPPLQIITTTEPSELIQTKGDPLFKKIPGISLSYAYNTDDDIFKDSTSREFIILLSGRWYGSLSLNGPWTYIPADKLPVEFAKIPHESEKARVLTHVPGTEAAQAAVKSANMLQVTKVDRKKTTVRVVYDGGAEFSSISNTGLFVSENSNIPVINSKDKYYALQDGVWFRSNEAIGPWEVSTERPVDIDKIPSTHRAYNTRYVYIYDTTAEYVYTGYTSEYRNSYIQNNTIVWGTGWPYKAWYRRSYYPREYTWGAGMYYRPGIGWSKRPGILYYKPDNN